MSQHVFYRAVKVDGLSRYTLYMQDYGGPVAT